MLRAAALRLRLCGLGGFVSVDPKRCCGEVLAAAAAVAGSFVRFVCSAAASAREQTAWAKSKQPILPDAIRFFPFLF